MFAFALVKYWAFLSYSHTDRKWGDWLHKGLETYRVPRRLAGKETGDGKIPARLFPIFRDREELPVSADLGSNIHEALRESRYLIVICSPRSAQSRWVGEEIKTFKKLGCEDRILALIVDGEPNASDAKPGFEAADECFHEAMRYRISPDGALGAQRTEPIAADAREGKDGKNNAKLKLLAGLLGVNYDDLKQRDQERRLRRARILGAAALVLVSIFAALAVALFFKEREAATARDEARARLSENYLDRALALLTTGDRRQGAANLVAALRANPNNSYAADRLLFELNYGDWIVATAFFSLPAEVRVASAGYEETEVLKARLSPDEKHVEATTLDFDGQPVRTFQRTIEQPSWKLIADRRKMRVVQTDVDGRRNRFVMTGASQDYELGISESDLRRLNGILPANYSPRAWAAGLPPTLFFSSDKRWAAMILPSEEANGDREVALIDWSEGQLIKLTESESLQGLPAFDSKHSLIWLFCPHSLDEYGQKRPILRAIDPIRKRVILKEWLPPTDGLEALRPRTTPDGNYLVLRYSIHNRPGEILNVFKIDEAGIELAQTSTSALHGSSPGSSGSDTPALRLLAGSVPFPGTLGELTNDGSRLVAILPTGIAIYKHLEHQHLQGIASDKASKIQFPSHPNGEINVLSADGKLRAVGNSQGHFTISDDRSGATIAAFESEFRPGEGGRVVIGAEFSRDWRWLMVWGYSIGGGYSDTEIYDPHSGRLIYPRLSEWSEPFEAFRFDAVQRVTDDQRSLMLLHGQILPLRFADGPVPERFAELLEAVIGAYIDARGVYHIAGTSDSRAIATTKEIHRLLARLDPASQWTRFANERFSSTLQSK